MTEKRIRIDAGGVTIFGRLNGSPMADAFWAALPVSGPADTWGDEIYFGIPVSAPDDIRPGEETVDLGAIGFWPPGHALCLFYGPTPMSRGSEIRPASAVHVLGMMEGDPKVLKKVQGGSRVEMTRA